jgi:hypothetical protein
MRKSVVTVVLAGSMLLAATPPALAAGGQGRSYSSLPFEPNGHVIIADRELQRFYNRAEADRRQVENLRNEQQLPDPSADPCRS